MDRVARVPNRERTGGQGEYRRSFSFPFCWSCPAVTGGDTGRRRRLRDGKSSRPTTPSPPRCRSGFRPPWRTEEAEEEDDASPPDNTAIGAREGVAPAASPLPEAKGESGVSAPPDGAARSASPPSAGTAPGGTISADATPSARRSKPAAAPHAVPASAPKETRAASPPGWAKSPEELVYRVDFIGITMGYARFRYQGKVMIAGKTAYHLNVRAWTSGVLSYIYPINDTIDYYLDAETLAPIRQEFTHPREGEGRRCPLRPGDREDHVQVPADGEDPEAGRPRSLQCTTR